VTTFNGIRPMLEVADVQEAASFYADRLGFEVVGHIEEPGGEWPWASVRRDGVGLMFTERHFHDDGPDEAHPEHPLLTGSLYLNVDDVDAVAEELRGRGVVLDFGPTDQPHGMREIGVTDPNGYFLLFGQDL
jgi:catechol 2,3-dioxygenase-like lactoylglutathione lyase family enzyme